MFRVCKYFDAKTSCPESLCQSNMSKDQENRALKLGSRFVMELNQVIAKKKPDQHIVHLRSQRKLISMSIVVP